MSLLLLLYRASRPNVAVLGRVPGAARQWGDIARHPENKQEAGVGVARVESGLFFANADHVRTAILALAAGTGGHRPRAIVLDAETVPFIDVTAARMLVQLAADLRRDGTELLLARDVGQVRDVLRRAGADARLQHVYPRVEEAVDAARALPPGPLPPVTPPGSSISRPESPPAPR